MSDPKDAFWRNSAVTWFEQTARDAEGNDVKMYSVVTPISTASQRFEDGQHTIEVFPGDRLVVLGAPNGDVSRLWLEVDEKDHAWTNAMIVLPANEVRYLCEVGDDLHMKARH